MAILPSAFSLLARASEAAATPAPARAPSFWDKISPEYLMGLFEKYGVNAVAALLIALAALVVSGWAARAIERSARKVKLDATLAKFFGKAGRWAVLALAGVFILNKFGVETSSFAVLIGSVGLAVGLAFQGTLSNVAAGIMLLIFRPFKVGDYIVVGSEEGVVEEIDLFTTGLNTLDNRYIITPNGKVFGEVIKNYSHNPTRRVDVAVGVAYAADMKETRRILLEAAEGVKKTLKDAPEMACAVYLVDLGASSLNWSVRVWCRQEEYWGARERLTEACKAALDAHNIVIPFPQMDLWIKQHQQ